MKANLIVFIVATLLGILVEAKTVTCKTRFKNDHQWQYCTKFGSAPNSSALISFKSRIKNFNSIKPARQTVDEDHLSATIEIAIYKDQQWD